MAQVISIEKSVQHNNGDSWELENYPPFAQNDNAEEWLGVSEISLERAKELAFQLAGDEAYDYEDEINDAEDLYELQDVLDNFKYYQRDNTYNSSWWGGVVDFGVLTEDGEGYGTGLVLLRMHRGGDPRGNYYDMRAFELDSFIEEFPPYLSRLSYYIKTDEGDLTLDSEDMEGYSLLVVEDETGTFEQDDYVKIDEVEDAFDMNGNSFFSFGGGVAVGSLIGAYIGYKVGRARGKRKGGTFDTEKKIYRKVKNKFAGGGGVGEELMGGQPNSSKPSGYTLVKAKGREIIVTEDGGKTQERWIKNNGYSGYTLHYNGNQYEFVSSFAVGGNVQSEISSINNRIYNLNQLRSVASNQDDIAYYNRQIGNLESEKEQLLNPRQEMPRKKLFGLFGEGGGVDGDELPYPYQMQWENLLRDFGTHYVMLKFPSGANDYYISRTKGNYSDDAIRQSLKSMNSSKLSQGGGIDDLIKG